MTAQEELQYQREAQERIIKALEENTKAVAELSKNMALHNEHQKPFEAMVAKHEKALYGDGTGNSKGYLQRFDDLETMVGKAAKGIERGLWAVAVAILGGIGLWMLEVVRLGLIPSVGGTK